MIEIERKFLVQGDFISHATRKEKIVQGYLCASVKRSVRVRIKGNSAYFTIKGPSNENGFSRSEFEYPLPVGDAVEILELCDLKIEKERYYVPVGQHTFEVDVFHGAHEGLIIAELELQSENEFFEIPDWLGKEVTGDERYYNAYLAKHTGF
ncbi:MAG: CYTH domain-containing protein [Dysgonamonadaceae bacterium]|jgi:CYTH domain-containing protein|nr:CYTH domain-containing protein [Dysgonamonadaceae bacterium]